MKAASGTLRWAFALWLAEVHWVQSLTLQISALGQWREGNVTCRADQAEKANYWALGKGSSTVADGCPKARAAKNFSHYTQTWPGAFSALYGEPAYEDPAVRTADGVFVWDAEYCLLSGFLDLPNKAELLQSYAGIVEKTEQDCQRASIKKAMSNNSIEELRATFGEVDAAFEKQHLLAAPARQAPLQAPGVLAKIQASHCLSGSYACMLHFCLYQYCKLGDGRIGMGCQCHSDWDLLPIPAE
eukprot:CAMPEP_0197621488 /NCGR_PEP_ID=MMETSP1338-20131121/2074_1 /TAXON_ID=43686 ORGANISM="Pelagodinium beii, Strain RCC1491" /NCGR_SAMPLE_ID=MMETSP1338 /ASSEMBLY_ACC=CAM_ASM_000754 /LENGTH=242 /DNA_ID=CAMNT_0043190985 /DNA_START=27 /DNA_END=755 /DNA_ORIENTATION=+